MKKFLIVVLALAPMLAFAAGKSKKAQVDMVGIEYLDSHFADYDKLSKAIHSYAEPGFQEFKSSALLISFLEENGFSVEKGVAGIPTAFVATFGTGTPVIGVLAEYDALPGLSQEAVPYRSPALQDGCGHGCGHNLLGTGATAAAVAISKWLAKGHTGTVKLFGCPAEEGGGAKNYMTRDGVFDGLDAVFIWHPGTRNCTNLCTGSACISLNVTFKGKTAHAGAGPWNGRSAFDAVESLDYMMNLMREHVHPDTRIHYAVVKTNPAPNVVPDVATVQYYLRHPKVEYAQEVLARLLKAAEGAALGTGTEMSYEVLNGSYPVLASETLCSIVCRKQQEVGGVILDEKEKDFCREILKNSNHDPEDFGNFAYVYPEVQPYRMVGSSSDAGSVSFMAPMSKLYVACNVVGTPGHSWQQTAVSGTTIGTKAVINVGKIYYLTALELYAHPETVQAAKEEFWKARGGKEFTYKSLVGDRKAPLDYRQ